MKHHMYKISEDTNRSNCTMGFKQKGPLKVTIVGDSMIGKTCMIYSYTHGTFPNRISSSRLNMEFSKTIYVDGKKIDLNLCDTCGSLAYEDLRALSYPETECFLLCFAIDNPASFVNIEEKWFPEVSRHCPNARIILVGTKSDLRERCSTACVSTMEARGMKVKIKASSYIECSAKTKHNLQPTFEETVTIAKNSSVINIACNIL